MSAAAISFRAPVLPWALAPEDEARFRRIRNTILLVATLACAAFLLLPRPPEERAAPKPLPPALARLMIERATPPVPLPKPVPPTPAQKLAAAKPEATPVPPTRQPEPERPRPQPRREAALKPEAKAPVPEARNPQPNKPPGEVLDGIRRKAAGVGLLAMKDTLQELHGAPVAVQLKQDIKPGPGVGTGSGVGVGAGSEAGVPVRALITANATGGSGGINTAGFSRDTGGGGLAGRSSTLVEGVAGGGGGGGAGGGGKAGTRGNGTGDGVGAGGGGGKGGTLTKSGSGKASRSLEDIKLVFERHKGAIYAIYNRALREDPTLQGKVVVELKIAPGGDVIGCRVVSSELKTPELEQKLVARIRQFDFGAKDVEQMVVTWPVDFLPS